MMTLFREQKSAEEMAATNRVAEATAAEVAAMNVEEVVHVKDAKPTEAADVDLEVKQQLDPPESMYR